MCPYAYLLDPGPRDASGLQLAGSIVLIDEAQFLASSISLALASLTTFCSPSNIENVCREAASFSYALLRLRGHAAVLAEMIKSVFAIDRKPFSDLLFFLRQLIEFTEEKVATIVVSDREDEVFVSCPTSDILNLLSRTLHFVSPSTSISDTPSERALNAYQGLRMQFNSILEMTIDKPDKPAKYDMVIVFQCPPFVF